MEDLSGQTISGYQLRQRVGFGGFGAVYRAYQASLDREVAVKVILPEHANKDNFIQRFRVEAKTIAKLEDPHIVPIYDYGQDAGGRVYLVMRWLGNGSLRGRLKNGPMPVEVLVRLLGQMSDALSEAHQKGIIHRDLKPDNILFDEKNNAYLTDFGIAKDLLSPLQITSTGAGLGTPAYAAPEQMFGQDITPQADIYSLGITLHECLTGRYPFVGNNLRHLNNPLPPLHISHPHLPNELDRVLRKATHKRPDERYPDVHSFTDDFQRAFTPSIAHPPLPPGNVLVFTPSLPPLLDDTPTAKNVEIITPILMSSEIPHAHLASPSLFISHSSKDDEVADRISNILLAAGINAWVDHRQLKPGENWDKAIQDSLNQCTAGIFILTPDSAKSIPCAAEREHLLSLNKLLHVALTKTIPKEDFPWRLRTVQYVDLREGKFEGGIAELISAIKEQRPLNLESAFVHLHEPDRPGSFKARIFRKAEDIENAKYKPRRLFGRKNVIRRIHKLLDANDYVLLHGLAGIGKTAVASTIAAERAAKGEMVIWLRAGNASVDTLFEALASGFDQQQSILKLEFDERVEVIRKLLEQQPGLLVLDDIWDEEALYKFLQAVPRTIPVLMTSRQTIYLEGETIELDELTPTEALQVLKHYARKSYTAAQSDAVALCEKLGNHPFALEIAGKRLNAKKGLSPQQLLDDIANAPHDLNIPGKFFEAGRGSIKELLDASVEELDVPVRKTLMMMGGLFTSRATLELLSLALAGDGMKSSEVATNVEALEHYGLLDLGIQDDKVTRYYRLHDLTFSYAGWMFVTERGNNQFVLDAVRQYVKDHLRQYKFIDYEKTNLLETAKASSGDALVDMMRMLSADGGYFEARGYNKASLNLMERAILAAKEQKQIRGNHILLTKLGNYYSTTVNELDHALALYDQAHRLAIEMGNIHRQTVLLTLISTVYSRLKKDDLAKQHSDQAYDLAMAHNNNPALSQIYEHLGHQARLNLNLEEAHRYYILSYEKISQLKNDATLDAEEQFEIDARRFYACLNLGAIENVFENFDAALPLHHQALEIAKRHDYRIWMGYASQSIGEAQHGKKAFDAAQPWFDDALNLYCQTGYRSDFNELANFMGDNPDWKYPVKIDCLEQGD